MASSDMSGNESKRRADDSSDKDSGTERPRKKQRGFRLTEGPRVTGKMVKVLVGSDKSPSYVYEEALLKGTAKFFQEALKETADSNTARVITLDDPRKEIFEIYVQWMYTGQVYFKNGHGLDDDWDDDSDDGPGDIPNEIGKENLQNLAHWDEGDILESLFTLGNLLRDNDFQDAMVDVIIEDMVISQKEEYWEDFTEWMFSSSTNGSPYRVLAVEAFVNFWDRTDTHDWLSSMSEENLRTFFSDAWRYMGSRLQEGIKLSTAAEFFKNKDTCTYHEHTRTNTPCCKIRPEFQS